MLSQNIMKSTVTVKLSFVTLNKIWIGYTHCKILYLAEWFLLFPSTSDTLSKVIKSIFILTIDNTQGGLLVTQLKVKVFSLGWQIKSHLSQRWIYCIEICLLFITISFIEAYMNHNQIQGIFNRPIYSIKFHILFPSFQFFMLVNFWRSIFSSITQIKRKRQYISRWNYEVQHISLKLCWHIQFILTPSFR